MYKVAILCRNLAHDKHVNFAMCLPLGTWQRGRRGSAVSGTLFFAVGRGRHTTKGLPCAPIKTHGKLLLPADLCRAGFAVCCTRQTFCRVLFSLCRVPLAHGKQAESRSACVLQLRRHYSPTGTGNAWWPCLISLLEQWFSHTCPTIFLHFCSVFNYLFHVTYLNFYWFSTIFIVACSNLICTNSSLIYTASSPHGGQHIRRNVNL